MACKIVIREAIYFAVVASRTLPNTQRTRTPGISKWLRHRHGEA